ncbi:MAG: LPS export ABC transporter permease LptG [Hyphomicrobium zavarzinii]|jgi:lipopolysaccharide export system permease protein|uniref:LPS export ABC transporter permease LptG n=1 Tax=Hyphomicrobium TaxID=81 RepID=UPI000361CF83|nr:MULTISPECIES: LPS export ABC transporter permease LptG [Hyphomicrobium]MBL8847604.1 LPS export ABC transporter permease LptG [Hyphomicrobium zavarzinii]WBT36411.1 LPS export ABC transporter permease LptG [Hyphomicrobium sp. DMF-1]HML42957.1 LPS export ABC transporter permease LptG [Hyphomicrobium zavarzinii]
MPGVSTLSVYIGMRFLIAIFAVFGLCTVLIFMIDFVELLRQAGKYGSVPAWLLAWITALRLPAYTEILLPFAVLVGSISALLMLARKSELAVMRAGGMSVWQFLRPGAAVAMMLGILSSTVFNPLAATARDSSEKLYSEAFGRESSLLGKGASGTWLRQDGLDGQSVLTAGSTRRRGTELTTVTAFVYDKSGRFSERVDASRAKLEEGYWVLESALVSRVGREPETFGKYLLSTYLTPERVVDALGSVISVSFWELPDLIYVTEKAGLSASKLRIQYELLLTRPLLCVAMVFLAATVSLRSFRSGGIQTMVVTGMIGGFGFFLFTEISRQIGTAGLAPIWAAVWVPVVLAILVSVTVLLHQEDG